MVAAAGSAPVSVDFGVVFSASCSTLASQNNITMLTNTATIAMASAAGIPASYLAIVGAVNNTCEQSQSRRRRSLFQLLSLAGLSSSSSSRNNPVSDGSVSLKMTVTWPADVVALTGLTPAQASLIVANCTAPQVMSSVFTPTFLAAYELRSIPLASTQSTVTSQRNSTYFTAEAAEGYYRGRDYVIQQPEQLQLL